MTLYCWIPLTLTVTQISTSILAVGINREHLACLWFDFLNEQELSVISGIQELAE